MISMKESLEDYDAQVVSNSGLSAMLALPVWAQQDK